tara:strand:- start:53 stop:322 length:270 start_codon:yes stop_codon:yes gene_type:complete
MATLMELVKIQAVIDNRAIASDTIETLETKYYYSRSKGVNIKLGDMHIDHFIRSLNLEDQHKSKADIEAVRLIEKLKRNLKKINKLIEV